MRSIELVWLSSLLFLLVFLIMEFHTLRPFNLIMIGVGILFSAIMFMYRRKERIAKAAQSERKLRKESQAPKSK